MNAIDEFQDEEAELTQYEKRLVERFFSMPDSGFSFDFSSYLEPAPQARRMAKLPHGPGEKSYNTFELSTYKYNGSLLSVMKRYKSVSDMVRAGYCLDHFGNLIPIPPGARIGLPDDDVPLRPEECRRMESAAENLRDLVLLGMMFRTGARISQVLDVHVGDLDFVQGRVFIRRRKEGVSFYRYLDPVFLSLLCRYVRHYGLVHDDFLFCIRFLPKTRGKWIKGPRPFRRHEVGDVVRYYAEKAGIQYRYVAQNGELRWRVHPHVSKYTYCSLGYDVSHDILATALSVGNTSTYPMEKSYIKVPVSRRHYIAYRVIERIMGREEPGGFDPETAYQNQASASDRSPREVRHAKDY